MSKKNMYTHWKVCLICTCQIFEKVPCKQFVGFRTFSNSQTNNFGGFFRPRNKPQLSKTCLGKKLQIFIF